jgi:cell division protein FtsZ
LAAEAAEADIRASLEGSHMLFITAGMGGGTGTGAAPVIARVAKDMGILTVGVVTKPFDWEGSRRSANADQGLSELEANVDSLIVVLNDKLHEVHGDDITQEEAFAHANDVLRNAVGGIAEIINVPGRVNVDFEDVKTVMGEPGKAMMGTAVATGPDRARIAAEQAVACPLLEGTDLTGAKGLLVLITAASKSLKLSESRTAMTTIKEYASKDAHVIYGTAYDESLGDAIRVTVVATGLSRQMAKRAAPPLQVLRTGTDNHAFAMPSMSPSAMGVGTSSAAMAGNSAATAASVPTVGTATLDGMGSASPRVWGTNRTHAAARVDALSSGGMDDYDIPAFLRKQAD